MSNSNQNFISKDSALDGILFVGGLAASALFSYLGGKTYDALKSLYYKHYGSKKTLEDVAKELNISAKEASDLLEKLNIAVASSDSYISKGQEELLKKNFEDSVHTFYKPKKEVGENGKIYMLDTNVLFEHRHIINILHFKNAVLIPEKVIDELDKFKISKDLKKGVRAKHVLKTIAGAVQHGDAEIVKIHNINNMPPELDPKSPDNIILCSAIEYNSSNFILFTSDTGFSVKAAGYGIKTQTLKEFCEANNIKLESEFNKKSKKTVSKDYNPHNNRSNEKTER